MSINFAQVIAYLDGIANQPGVILGNSPHGAFWRAGGQPLTRDEFVAANVPGTTCRITVNGVVQKVPIPVVRPHDSANSPFFQILIGDLKLPMTDGTICSKDQMPGGGPFITDLGASITLADGSSVTGAQIQADLKDWIDVGCPA